MNIMITSVGTATSVNLIRYFRKLGHRVIGCDINPYGLTAGSLMIEAYVRVPLAKDPEFIPTVLDVVKKQQVQLLIPINDVEVEVVSNHLEDLKKLGCLCVIPTKKSIELFRDKYECNKAMAKIGVPVPKILEEDNASIKRILRDREGVGSKGILILEKGTPAPKYDKNKQFIQNFVNGEEYTIDALCDLNGNPIYLVPRLRMEVKSGVATKVKIVKDEQLIAFAKKILEAYPIPGFSNLQFFKEASGHYWFIEVNTRFSGCGAATLATCENYLPSFLKALNGNSYKGNLNADVKWDSVVTRYYEEVVYEAGNR